MKNILEKLESSNFIHETHRRLMWADAIKFMEQNKYTNKKLNDGFIKSYLLKHIRNGELRIRFNLMATGFYQYLKFYFSDSKEYMLSCSIDDDLMLVAFLDTKNQNSIKLYNFTLYNVIPIHQTIINLDFKTKVHILMYDKRFKLPGMELN